MAMPRATETRARVVRRAAEVFNIHGFNGTSMNDLLTEVGLQKGGLYNHFGSKEQLALEAFDYSVGRIAERFRDALEPLTSATDRLDAVIAVIRGSVDDPVMRGGCPIMNTAIESDDTHPPLRDRARAAMTQWQRLIGSIVREGVKSGELLPGTNPRTVATVLTATLEGAVMLAQLYDDPSYMKRAVDHCAGYVRSLAAPRRRTSRRSR